MALIITFFTLSKSLAWNRQCSHFLSPWACQQIFWPDHLSQIGRLVKAAVRILLHNLLAHEVGGGVLQQGAGGDVQCSAVRVAVGHLLKVGLQQQQRLAEEALRKSPGSICLRGRRRRT